MCAGAELAHFMLVNAAFFICSSHQLEKPSTAHFEPSHRNYRPSWQKVSHYLPSLFPGPNSQTWKKIKPGTKSARARKYTTRIMSTMLQNMLTFHEGGSFVRTLSLCLFQQ